LVVRWRIFKGGRSATISAGRREKERQKRETKLLSNKGNDRQVGHQVCGCQKDAELKKVSEEKREDERKREKTGRKSAFSRANLRCRRPELRVKHQEPEGVNNLAFRTKI